MNSTRINDRRASCDGKETYDSWDSAERAQKRCAKKGRPAKIFRCDFCHKWHLASPFKKPKTDFDAELPFQKGDIIPSLGIRIR